MHNYETLKELATTIRKEHKVKCRVSDLFALAPANDPFYMGTEADVENGKWFSDLWERFNYVGQRGIHLRRVHYQIISQENPVLMSNGKPYTNTEECWKYLNQASKCARYLEYVDAESFVDRRNPDPKIFGEWGEVETELEIDNNLLFDSFTFPEFPECPEFTIQGRDADLQPTTPFPVQQVYQVEIWCEKSTMNDVLIPLCQKYKVNLVTGVGEQSITSTIELVKRSNIHKKPVRVLYVSDFDPAGKSMPLAVSRKVEYFINKLYSDLDFRVFHVVLTEEQVKHYKLPRTPIKETERRKDRFEEHYGTGATELDALEALYPGTLRDILEKHISNYYDKTLQQRIDEFREEIDYDLQEIQEDIVRRHKKDIDQLVEEYGEIKAEFEEHMKNFQESLERVWQAMTDEMEAVQPNLDTYEQPEAEGLTEIGEGLYNSQRSYEEQLVTYKEFQGKGNGNLAHLSEVLLSEH
jgi:hypothetical protein